MLDYFTSIQIHPKFYKDAEINLIKVSEIYNLFNKHYKKINGSDFKIFFKSKKANENSVKLKKNCVYFKKGSSVLLRKYLNNSIYEKRCNICNHKFIDKLSLGKHPCADAFLKNRLKAQKLKDIT